MILVLLAIGFFSVYIFKWLIDRQFQPPGPPEQLLPLPILRHLWWSEFYGKNDMEIIIELEKRYDGIFSVHLGYRKVVIISDFEKVQVISFFI